MAKKVLVYLAMLAMTVGVFFAVAHVGRDLTTVATGPLLGLVEPAHETVALASVSE